MGTSCKHPLKVSITSVFSFFSTIQPPLFAASNPNNRVSQQGANAAITVACFLRDVCLAFYVTSERLPESRGQVFVTATWLAHGWLYPSLQGLLVRSSIILVKGCLIRRVTEIVRLSLKTIVLLMALKFNCRVSILHPGN
jgi:hypothetical protein